MLCPKCKNPIEDNATVCEWCGANIIPDIQNAPIDSCVMIIEDVFSIFGRGTVVTGVLKMEITAGKDEHIEIVSSDGNRKESVITGIEQNRKIIKKAQTGELVGLLLRGINAKDIHKGMLIIKK